MSRHRIGILCLVFSCLFYGGLLLLPWVPFGPRGQAITAAGLVIVGEAVFWLGCLFVGREVMVRYRRWLNPRSWFRSPSAQAAPSVGEDR
ncbi:MAG: transporter suffix domain-containing protein [Nitrospirae bacterium]|nr:transporter suffix domain-containing protein [Nitrospirota bacterium]